MKPKWSLARKGEQSVLNRRLVNFMLGEEEDYRRHLFGAAAKGDLAAQEELRRTYHVRIYSASERAQLACHNEALASPGRRKRMKQR